MANIPTLDAAGKVVPKDLAISAQPDVDKNYFDIKVTNLKVYQPYSFQFQWIYEDGTVSDWSPGYTLTTSNESSPAVPTGTEVPSTATGSIPVALTSYPANAKRVDVYVSGGIFGTSKIAYSFTSAGKTTIAAPAGEYTVQLRSVSPTGVMSTVGTTYTITVASVGEVIEAPTSPNGFSSKRILAGIEVTWAGTYATSGFSGFEAINLYAGTSSSATSGTYTQVGSFTGNNVVNTVTVPVDGTYVKYGQATYFHAASVAKDGDVGTIQANVTNQALGPGKASDADINDGAIFIEKLASNVLTVGNLKAGDINITSYIRAGSKASNGLTGARIELSTSTITQTGTNVLPGLYIYGSDGTQVLKAPLGGGLEITGSGTFTGNLAIGTSPNIFKAEPATGIWLGASAYADANFSVSTTGQLKALDATIGGWILNEQAFKSSAVAYPLVEIDPVGHKIELRTAAGSSEAAGVSYIKMDTTNGLRIGTVGQDGEPAFQVAMSGSLTARDATLYGKLISSGTSPVGTGILTIDSGYITQTAWMYISTPSYLVQTTDGNLGIYPNGDFIAGGGNGTGDLQIRIQNTTFAGDPYFGRGYIFWGLGGTEFLDPYRTTNDSSVVGATVAIDITHKLVRGRTLFQGAQASATAINNLYLGETGDLYFSTA